MNVLGRPDRREYDRGAGERQQAASEKISADWIAR
jgi:hypothetical protein